MHDSFTLKLKVYIKVVYKKPAEKVDISQREGSPTNTQSTESSNASEKAFSRAQTHDERLEKREISEEIMLFNLKQSIRTEVEKFTNLITLPEIRNSKTSTSKFWRKNEDKLPKLFKLVSVLNNIQCSAAYIERLFMFLQETNFFLFKSIKVK